MKKLKKMSRTKKENQKKSLFKKTSIKGKINLAQSQILWDKGFLT